MKYYFRELANDCTGTHLSLLSRLWVAHRSTNVANSLFLDLRYGNPSPRIYTKDGSLSDKDLLWNEVEKCCTKKVWTF